MALTNKQSGTVTLSGTSVTDTPSSYTLAQSVLWFSHSGGGTSAPEHGFVRGEKTDSITLTFTRNEATGDSPVIEWQLFEFDSDMNVQDVVSSPDWDNSKTVETETISAVVAANAWIVAGGIAQSGGGVQQDDRISIKFNSTTVVEFECVGAPNLGSSICQVVEYVPANVQTQNDTFVDTTSSSETSSAFSAVVEASTFVECTYETDKGTFFARNLWSHILSSTTQVTYRRVLATDLTPQFELMVVELDGDATSVQDGQHTLASGDLSDPITISSVTEADSLSLLGGCSDQRSHGTSDQTTDDTALAHMTVDFNSGTEIRVDRTAGAGTANDIDWQVIEWARAAAAAFPVVNRHIGMADPYGVLVR